MESFSKLQLHNFKIWNLACMSCSPSAAVVTTCPLESCSSAETVSYTAISSATTTSALSTGIAPSAVWIKDEAANFVFGENHFLKFVATLNTNLYDVDLLSICLQRRRGRHRLFFDGLLGGDYRRDLRGLPFRRCLHGILGLALHLLDDGHAGGLARLPLGGGGGDAHVRDVGVDRGLGRGSRPSRRRTKRGS